MAQYSMSFDEFKNQLTNKPPKFKNDEELFEDCGAIIDAVRTQNGNL